MIFFRSLRRGNERLPFLMALALFLLNFVGLGVSVYPVSRAARDHHLGCRRPGAEPTFMLIGAAVILPIIIGYTVGLLGVPRQSRHPRVSLMRTAGLALWKRLAWMLLIWSASVAALAAVSFVLRLWLKAP